MKNYNLPKNHTNHEIKIVKGPFGPHYSKMICLQCNKFVKWANQQEYEIYKELTNEQVQD